MNIRRQDGFTLVEILVAMTVIAFSLAALIQASGQSTSNAAALRDRTYAQWVAANALVELRTDPEVSKEMSRRGEEQMASQQWRWRAEVIETADPDLLRIDVEVLNPDSDTSLVTLTGFKGRSRVKQ